MNPESNFSFDAHDASGDSPDAVNADSDVLRQQSVNVDSLQAELLQVRCRLDREERRLESMQRFCECAVLAKTNADFGQMVCDTIVDLFGCGVGIVWSLQGDHDSSGQMFQSGIGEVSENDRRQLNDWVGKWLALDDGVNPVSTAMPLPLGFGLGEDFLAASVIDPSGLLQAVMFAANPQGETWLEEKDWKDRRDRLFYRFAKQVGVLSTSLIRQMGIAAQNDKIQIAEDRLSTALACSRVGLWEWDLKSNLVLYSEQWKLQLGLTTEEVGNSPDELFDRLHSDDVARARDICDQVAVTPGGVFDDDFRIRHRDGHWRWINLCGMNNSSPDGRFHRLIGTHSDITEFKELERRLRDVEGLQLQRRERAERQNHAKSSFLASVSHEIRTPLNGMMGAFQLLRRIEKDPQHEKLLDIGERAGNWMLKIIDESCEHAALDSGDIQLNQEVADLHGLLVDLEKTEQQLAKGRGIDFQWSVSSDVPRWVCMDSIRLRQILSNLIGNACKFTPLGSVVFEASVRKTLKDRKQLVRFSVKDSGVGLSKDFTQILFEPFTQEKDRSQSPESGIGLGLVITKQLIELMGGEIKVQSKLGTGSEFVVDIPLEECSGPAVPKPEASLAALPVFEGKVLLAEDDESSGLLAKLMLERLGLEVDLVVDGGQALESAGSECYDLIFLDCWMPVVNGIEVVCKLRSSPEMDSSAAPVVALTANSSSSDAAECRDAGMNDFMTKPLIFNDLIAMLHKFLPLKAKEQCLG